MELILIADSLEFRAWEQTTFEAAGMLYCSLWGISPRLLRFIPSGV